jgi:hypothetical protein
MDPMLELQYNSDKIDEWFRSLNFKKEDIIQTD